MARHKLFMAASLAQSPLAGSESARRLALALRTELMLKRREMDATKDPVLYAGKVKTDPPPLPCILHHPRAQLRTVPQHERCRWHSPTGSRCLLRVVYTPGSRGYSC
jgi:hypothetical protein